MQPAFNIMSANDIGRFFADRTFWTQGSPYRLYFDGGKKFMHQTNGTVGNLPAGRHTGIWSVDSAGRLCLAYHSAPEADACYLVLKGGDDMRPWGKFDDPVILAPVPGKEPASAGAALAVNRWGQGNLILDDAFFKGFPAMLDELIALRVDMAEGEAIPQSSTADLSLARYMREMVGGIMVFPLGGGTFHAPDGRAMTLSADEVAAMERNPTQAALPDRPFDSRWFVDGNTQCWVSVADSRDTLCQKIFSGASLLHSDDTMYVSHTQDGYTRIMGKDSFIPLR